MKLQRMMQLLEVSVVQHKKLLINILLLLLILFLV